MSVRRDPPDTVRRLPIDDETAGRLLAGAIAPDDAPAGYGGVAALVGALTAPATTAELHRQAQTIEAMREEIVRSSLVAPPMPKPMPKPMPTRKPAASGRARLRMVAVVVVGTLVLGTGMAMAGVLPPPVQRFAATVLSRVGITVPSPNSTSGPPAGRHSNNGGHGTGGEHVGPTHPPGHGGHGNSSGSSGHNGQHGKSGQPHGKSGQPHGKSGQPHGKSGQPHGKSGQPHGKSSGSPGRSGGHGKSSQSPGHNEQGGGSTSHGNSGGSHQPQGHTGSGGGSTGSGSSGDHGNGHGNSNRGGGGHGKGAGAGRGS
jgi:hypothetical protein